MKKEMQPQEATLRPEGRHSGSCGGPSVGFQRESAVEFRKTTAELIPLSTVRHQRGFRRWEKGLYISRA
jgi:hypothetical protein